MKMILGTQFIKFNYRCTGEEGCSYFSFGILSWQGNYFRHISTLVANLFPDLFPELDSLRFMLQALHFSEIVEFKNSDIQAWLFT